MEGGFDWVLDSVDKWEYEFGVEEISNKGEKGRVWLVVSGSDNEREYEFSTKEIFDERKRGRVKLIALESGDERD